MTSQTRTLAAPEADASGERVGDVLLGGSEVHG